jgi:putative DNA primase/helicase
VVKAAKGELSQTADRAEEILISAKVSFYERSNKLVRPIIRTVDGFRDKQTSVAQLATIEAVYLRDVLGRVEDWRRFDVRTETWVPIDPPHDIASTVLARSGEWKFPTVSGVITTQTMRPDGTIIDRPGYDPATRLLLVDPPSMGAIPEDPTREDAEAALALLSELLAEFPLVDAVARCVAFSILITPVVRGAFPVAPMHVTDAPVAGSGRVTSSTSHRS